MRRECHEESAGSVCLAAGGDADGVAVDDAGAEGGDGLGGNDVGGEDVAHDGRGEGYGVTVWWGDVSGDVFESGGDGKHLVGAGAVAAGGTEGGVVGLGGVRGGRRVGLGAMVTAVAAVVVVVVMMMVVCMACADAMRVSWIILQQILP